MENALRYVIVFLWCVGFGFFSVLGYLGDPMTAQKSTAILAGLLAGLGIYGAIEWLPKIKGWQSIRAGWNERIRTLYARLSHGIRASLSFYEHISRGIRTVLHLVRTHCAQNSSLCDGHQFPFRQNSCLSDVRQSPHLGQHQKTIPADKQALGFFQRPLTSFSETVQRAFVYCNPARDNARLGARFKANANSRRASSRFPRLRSTSPSNSCVGLTGYTGPAVNGMASSKAAVFP